MPTGVYARTAEHGRKISNGLMGKRCSEATKKKIGDANRGKYLGKNGPRYIDGRCDDRKKYLREYHQTHKKERVEYKRKKRKEDPKFRIDYSMSCSIRKSLKGRKGGRRWEDLVGYTAEDLMKHLENLFKPWMNWDNYGKWHIDHIKPKSLFDYESTEDAEFRLCWALSNLQPLEAIENIRKSNKYEEINTAGF